MFKKHWKGILLSLCAMLWIGCVDDAPSDENAEPTTGSKLVACELDHMWSDDDPKCINPYSCMDTYYCKDKAVCFKKKEGKSFSFDCFDKNENKVIYTEDEFNSRYYVESERIH